MKKGHIELWFLTYLLVISAKSYDACIVNQTVRHEYMGGHQWASPEKNPPSIIHITMTVLILAS